MRRNAFPVERGHELLRADRRGALGQTGGESQRTDDLLGAEALAQQAKVEVLVALGQAAAVYIAQQRNMDKVRRLEGPSSTVTAS